MSKVCFNLETPKINEIGIKKKVIQPKPELLKVAMLVPLSWLHLKQRIELCYAFQNLNRNIKYARHMRNKGLDTSKGIAIILVVLGHTIQNLDKFFDYNSVFRVIYAFHMPFFIMLSGASASYWYRDLVLIQNSRKKIVNSVKRVKKTALMLLIPFYSWSVFDFYYSKKKVSVLDYLGNITIRTDLSLWFLPCLFCCIFYLIVGISTIELIIKKFPTRWSNYNINQNPNLQILYVLILWLFSRIKIPNFLGTGMANTFHGGLFLFFLAGIAIQLNWNWFKQNSMMPATMLFAISVPFWSRINTFNSINSAPAFLKNYYVGAVYTVVVALSGSMAIYICVNRYWSNLPDRIVNIFAILGSNTLGIYAIHGYFIASKVPVITPILTSLVITIIISRTPILRTLLLGKLGLKPS